MWRVYIESMLPQNWDVFPFFIVKKCNDWLVLVTVFPKWWEITQCHYIVIDVHINPSCYLSSQINWNELIHLTYCCSFTVNRNWKDSKQFSKTWRSGRWKGASTCGPMETVVERARGQPLRYGDREGIWNSTRPSMWDRLRNYLW